MSEKVILKVEGLKTYFETESGIVKAVDDINFQLLEGESLGVVGESGSGKSITALSLVGLAPKTAKISGKIYFNGLEIQTEGIHKQIRGKEIAMIFQEPMSSLNPVIKCGDQIIEAIQLHQKVSKNLAKTHVLDLLTKVKLGDPLRVFRSYPHQLSGGEKQRVMIAMALSCKPKILIADEPTTALDVTVQKSILELLQELRKTFDMTLIFISHDLNVVAEIADRVLVMYRGKVVESGLVNEVLTKPKHEYTRSLIASIPPINQKLKRLPISFKESEQEILSEQGIVGQSIDDQIIKTKNQKERLKRLASKPPILEVEKLKTWFPKKQGLFSKKKEYVKAVDDLSFKVYPGETLGLVGESGSGKTTLGRTILKLEKAFEGKILFQGKPLLSREPIDFRKDIQIIFQDPYSSLNPRKPIGFTLMEPLMKYSKKKKDIREKAIALLEAVGLNKDHFYRMPHEFSGGQRQRISIARALATEPKLIICDECVSALDVSIQAQILNLLKDLQEKNDLTYIFISHDLSVVNFMSDRIVVMNKGRIEEIGSPDEIYLSPQKEYTKKLIAAIPKNL